MKQQDIYEKMLKKQEERIQEMENLISILEEQNSRKDQMIAELQKACLMQEKLDDPDYKKTSRTIVKQLVNVRLVLDVAEYHADIYRNSKTGEQYHADFPAGVVDDVNYGGSVKAFLFLLNNDCCTSIDKSRKFLSDLTGGRP